MTDRCETYTDCRITIPLSSLKVSNIYTIASGFYGSPNEQNWMCELCTFSQIQSHICESGNNSARKYFHHWCDIMKIKSIE